MSPADTAIVSPTRRAARFEWERALRADRTLKERPHHVALVLATYADADGTNVRPKVKTVARDARMPESTTRAHLKTLRDLGWLRRVKRGSFGGTADAADVHELTVPVGAAVGRSPADPDDIVPPPTRERSSEPAVPRQRSTSAHQPAVPPTTTADEPALPTPDHRSPVSAPPLASERTTAHQPAPTNHHQIMTKAARADDAAPPPPRCPRCSDQPPGSWGPPCGDCAALGRAHRARLTDLTRAYARARRCCTECDAFGFLLGPDRERLDLRCDHPTVAPEVWAGETLAAPPVPPPLEAPTYEGRHRAEHPPGWRPSPHPRPDQETLTDVR